MKEPVYDTTQYVEMLKEMDDLLYRTLNGTIEPDHMRNVANIFYDTGFELDRVFATTKASDSDLKESVSNFIDDLKAALWDYSAQIDSAADEFETEIMYTQQNDSYNSYYYREGRSR